MNTLVLARRYGKSNQTKILRPRSIPFLYNNTTIFVSKEISQKSSQYVISRILQWNYTWLWRTCPWWTQRIVIFSKNWQQPKHTWWKRSRIWQTSWGCKWEPYRISLSLQVKPQATRFQMQTQEKKKSEDSTIKKNVLLELQIQVPQNTFKWKFLEK